MEQLKEANLSELASHCKSKKEMYKLLTNSWDIYLPLIEYANAMDIRNILTGKHKVLELVNDNAS